MSRAGAFDPRGLSYDDLVGIVQSAQRELLALRPAEYQEGYWATDQDLAGLRRIVIKGDGASDVWRWRTLPLRLPAPETLAPFPDLPIEVVICILEHADEPTLAAFCRANSSMLELASPILYREVEFKSADEMDRLFSRTHHPLFSSLLPCLSLDRVTTLALDLCYLYRPLPFLAFPAVQNLMIGVQCSCSCCSDVRSIYDLISRLNPETLVLCLRHERLDCSIPSTGDRPPIKSTPRSWNRLRNIVFDGWIHDYCADDPWQPFDDSSPALLALDVRPRLQWRIEDESDETRLDWWLLKRRGVLGLEDVIRDGFDLLVETEEARVVVQRQVEEAKEQTSKSQSWRRSKKGLKFRSDKEEAAFPVVQVLCRPR